MNKRLDEQSAMESFSNYRTPGMQLRTMLEKVKAVGANLLLLALLLLRCHASPTAPQPPKTLEVVFPNGGEMLFVDSTYTLVAVFDSTMADRHVEFFLSPDNGASWSQPLLGMAFTAQGRRIEIPFTIPATLQGKPTKTNQGLVKVRCYESQDIFDISDGCFTIQ
jgi:hypothetical protein